MITVTLAAYGIQSLNLVSNLESYKISEHVSMAALALLLLYRSFIVTFVLTAHLVLVAGGA